MLLAGYCVGNKEFAVIHQTPRFRVSCVADKKIRDCKKLSPYSFCIGTSHAERCEEKTDYARDFGTKHNSGIAY